MTAIIILVVIGPHVIRKVWNLFNKNKKPSTPDSDVYEKEKYRAILLSNMEKQLAISKYLKRGFMEGSTNESDPQDMEDTQGKGPEAIKDRTKN